MVERSVCPAAIYLFKVNRNTRRMCEIYSKLTLKTTERRHWRRSIVFTVNLNRFHSLFWCFYCWLWTSKCRPGEIGKYCRNAIEIISQKVQIHAKRSRKKLSCQRYFAISICSNFGQWFLRILASWLEPMVFRNLNFLGVWDWWKQ